MKDIVHNSVNPPLNTVNSELEAALNYKPPSNRSRNKTQFLLSKFRAKISSKKLEAAASNWELTVLFFIAKMPVLDLICGQTFHNWKIIFHQSLQHFLKQWTLKNDRSHFGRAGGDASKCVSSCVHCVRSFISIGLWRPQPIFVSSYLYLDFLVNFRRSSLKTVWRKNSRLVFHVQ